MGKKIKKCKGNDSFFNKDYKTRREFFHKFTLNPEIDLILDIVSDSCIVYDSYNFFCGLDVLNLNAENKQEEIIKSINDNFENIYSYFHFNDDASAWKYFKQFLIDGFLAFEIIYDENKTKIIGFKEIDPVSIRPAVEEDEEGWKKVWFQYEDSPQLKRKLMDSQIIYISYKKGLNGNYTSYIESLLYNFNLFKIMENNHIIHSIISKSLDFNKDVIGYFYNKLKWVSKIPSSWFNIDNDQDLKYNSREEARFSKFKNDLRNIFKEIILKPLCIQTVIDYPELINEELNKKINIKYY